MNITAEKFISFAKDFLKFTSPASDPKNSQVLIREHWTQKTDNYRADWRSLFTVWSAKVIKNQTFLPAEDILGRNVNIIS